VKVMLAIDVGTTVLISREKTADYGRVEYNLLSTCLAVGGWTIFFASATVTFPGIAGRTKKPFLLDLLLTEKKRVRFLH
jgi:hypothetical protein